MPEDFASQLDDSKEELYAGQLKPEDLTDSEEKKELEGMKKRNKYLLLGLTDQEKERIANHIIALYDEAKTEHEDLCEKLSSWDECSRLVRKEVIGSQGNLPNYRLPVSLLSHEVIHANIMNVFFSPQDIMRVIPTAAEDVPKVNNISVFGNWSMKNELDLFAAFDRLDHASIKNGEAVGMIYWKREFGVDIERIPMRDGEGEIQYDSETKELIYQEKEVTKILYDAPVFELIDRKDYIQPPYALMNQEPEWEGRIVRISYDTYLREELQGRYYPGSIDHIQDWPNTSKTLNEKEDLDGNDMLVPKWNKEFLEFYGRLRINVIENEMMGEEIVKAHELEDEFIAVVHIQSRTLSQLRKNRFPLKKRPFINDYFMPDDTGRRAGIGVYELMDPLQKCYDNLYNQFIYGVELSNNPIVFFSPTGNMRDERFKIEKGYAYPTSDPNSVKLFSFPPPNDSIREAMGMVQQWAQFLFGISDYAAGMTSDIDPSASGKKVQLIVEQGNVRLNMIIKRKNDTLKEIFKRWFLLYQANMPPNKFMRIAGEQDDPWKFNAITYEDFALQSLPDFELTGNVLNANKQLEANKAIAIYQLLAPNFLFNVQTSQGLQLYTSLTKWLIDKIGDAELSRFIPGTDTEGVTYTPEEEDAMMLQGDQVDPQPNEDVAYHLKVHMAYLNGNQCPDQIKPLIADHISKTIQLAKQQMAQKLAMQQAGIGPTVPGANPGGQQPLQNGLQMPQNPPQGPQMRNGMVGGAPKVGQGMPVHNRPMAGAGMPGNGVPQ